MAKTSITQNEMAEHTALSVHIAVADFMGAIQAARTSDEALAIHHLIAEGVRSLEAMESAALDRADALNRS